MSSWLMLIDTWVEIKEIQLQTQGLNKWGLNKIVDIFHMVFWSFFRNSLAPGGFGCNFKTSLFKLALLIGTFRASFDKVLRWMMQDLTDDESTLVQVMAWCHQATSHYLSQCWTRSMSPYGIIRPQWVKASACILIHSFFTEVCSWGSNISALAPAMAWCQISTKPLPELMVTLYSSLN